MDKREIKVTCDKIEEHLFPVISEFVHSGSKLFWISSHPFFYVWTSLVNKWNGTCILLFRCSYCIYFQVLSNYLCFQSIALYFIFSGTEFYGNKICVNILLFLSLENQKLNTSQYILFFLYHFRTKQIMHFYLKDITNRLDFFFL